MLIRENEQLLHETGLFRIHQPKRFAGMELDFVAIVGIPAEFGRGCPSTAWNVGNLASHHWLLGYYDPETQHEVWDANPDALIASSVALAAECARRSEGGFIVTGRWPFSSGVDNSDWSMLAVTVYDDDGKTPLGRGNGGRKRQAVSGLAAASSSHALDCAPGFSLTYETRRRLVRNGYQIVPKPAADKSPKPALLDQNDDD
jgi:alkylation response protein AidB-like acyl-CoA dehydrogenase